MTTNHQAEKLARLLEHAAARCREVDDQGLTETPFALSLILLEPGKEATSFTYTTGKRMSDHTSFASMLIGFLVQQQVALTQTVSKSIRESLFLRHVLR